MMRKEKKKKQEFCQSRFYKDWNPDIMADYNRWRDNDNDDDDRYSMIINYNWLFRKKGLNLFSCAPD